MSLERWFLHSCAGVLYLCFDRRTATYLSPSAWASHVKHPNIFIQLGKGKMNINREIVFIPLCPVCSDEDCALFPPFLGSLPAPAVWDWGFAPPLKSRFWKNSCKDDHSGLLSHLDKEHCSILRYTYHTKEYKRTLFFCRLNSFILSFLESSRENSTIGLCRMT